MLNQNELAEEFGMSRIPIRDALRALEAEGLVVLRAHASASVTPLSLDDLAELYELRLALEPALCRLSAPHLTSQDVRDLASHLQAMDETADPDAWLRLNNQFHELLYRNSGRPRTIEIIRRAREATLRYTRIYQGIAGGTVDEGHRMICEAATAGHARRLEALVAAHLSDGYESMMTYLARTEELGRDDMSGGIDE
jgi:DNA-binding GntR family transcriptional regulator